jgi:hypothetical protein
MCLQYLKRNCGKHTKHKKRPENKNFWQKNLEMETLAFYIQGIDTIKSITTLVDPNHLLQGDSSNGARGKMRHPLKAIYL